VKTSKYFLSVFCLLLSSCSSKHGQGINPNDIDLSEFLSSPEQIVFSHIQQFVFKNNCMECHNSNDKEDGIDLTNYATVLNGFKEIVIPYNPLLSKLYTSLDAKGKRHMPPLDKPMLQLSKDQKLLIYAWIENGAKNNINDIVQAPKTIKDQLKPYFEKPETIDFGVMNDYVLNKNCNSCHSKKFKNYDKDALYGVDFTKYSQIFPTFNGQPFGKQGLVKGDPEKSRIYQSAVITQRMPLEEEGYDLMNVYESKLMRYWILNCAIEDYSALTEDNIIPIEKRNKDKPFKVRNCN